MSIELRIQAYRAQRMVNDITGRLQNPSTLLDFMGEQLEDYEAEVFATAGFGEWAALSPDTVRAKGSNRVLIDTGGLLDSLTGAGSARTQGEGVTLSTTHPAAEFLKRGARGTPKRDPAPTPPASRINSWADEVLGVLVTGRRR